MRNVKSYEENEETLDLLKNLVIGNNQIEQRQIPSAEAAVQHIRRRRKRCISSLGYGSFS